MKIVNFPFDRQRSSILGAVHRPVARVALWSARSESWVGVVMLVDTGADYTLLPRIYATILGVNLQRNCRRLLTAGIGGTERVYLLPQLRMRLGPWRGSIPVGFLNHDDVPPLLGRARCLDTFDVCFRRHRTTFTRPKAREPRR